MSKRQAIVDRISCFIRNNELDGVYHYSDKQELKTKLGRIFKIYVINFAKPRTLDAEIQIYGKGFIRLSFQTAYRDLPQKDNLVFKSEQDLIDFMKFAFVDIDADKAYQVPRK